MAADSELHAKVRTGSDRRLPCGHGGRTVVGVKLFQPAETELLSLGTPVNSIPWRLR